MLPDVGAKEAAQILGLNRSTITRWVARGLLPDRRDENGALRFPRRIVDELADAYIHPGKGPGRFAA